MMIPGMSLKINKKRRSEAQVMLEMWPKHLLQFTMLFPSFDVGQRARTIRHEFSIAPRATQQQLGQMIKVTIATLNNNNNNKFYLKAPFRTLKETVHSRIIKTT